MKARGIARLAFGCTDVALNLPLALPNRDASYPFCDNNVPRLTYFSGPVATTVIFDIDSAGSPRVSPRLFGSYYPPKEESKACVADMVVTLRPPTASQLPQPDDFHPPSLDWLKGTWTVTHSTLPMWKTKRNVRITYTVLSNNPKHDATENTSNQLDDLVSYQTLDSDKVKQVHGIDTAAGSEGGAWDWRGKGLLKIASSHWEILGWGNESGSVNEATSTADHVESQWAVTYFAKTLFTPAGIDVYSRTDKGLSEETLSAIKNTLQELKDPNIQKLAGELFEVKRN